VKQTPFVMMLRISELENVGEFASGMRFFLRLRTSMDATYN
jgi:hypothetical protein